LACGVVARRILEGMAEITLGQVSIHLAAVCVGLGFVVPPVSAGQGLDVSMQQGRITILAQQVSVKASSKSGVVSAIPPSSTPTTSLTRL